MIVWVCPYCHGFPLTEGFGHCGESPAKMVRVSLEYVYPPIPVRDHDWSAIIDGEYDGAPDAGPQLLGWGRTREEAIADLMEQYDEREADREYDRKVAAADDAQRDERDDPDGFDSKPYVHGRDY